MSKYVVTAVHPIYVPVIWQQVADYISDAISYSNGEKDIQHVYDELMNGDSNLVIIYFEQTIYGAAILSKRIFDTGKSALFVSLLGGINMNEWIEDAHFVANKIAKDLCCDSIYCVGRQGWEKALKGIGYDKAYTILSIEVNHE